MAQLRNIEFFTDPHGNVMVSDADGIRSFKQEDVELTSVLFVRIEDEYPEAFRALSELYRKSQPNAPYFRYLVVSRFIRCNFSAYDRRVDVSASGQFQLEEVQCPLRTECLYAGLICDAKFNTNLTQRQTEVMRLYCEGLSEAEIASELYISPKTVHTTKINAFRKAGVHSLAEFIKKHPNL